MIKLELSILLEVPTREGFEELTEWDANRIEEIIDTMKDACTKSKMVNKVIQTDWRVVG